MILNKLAADAPQEYINKYLLLPGIAMYFAGQWIVNLNIVVTWIVLTAIYVKFW